MSLTHAMSTLTRSLAAARAARRDALGRIRKSTAQHLNGARQARRAMAAAHALRIAEFMHSLHVTTAVLLGAAHDRIDAYGRQRAQLASIRRQRRREGAEAMRRATGQGLRAAAEKRRAAAASGRAERTARRSALRQQVRQQKARTLSMMQGLHKDRAGAAQIWGKAPRRATAGAK